MIVRAFVTFPLYLHSRAMPAPDIILVVPPIAHTLHTQAVPHGRSPIGADPKDQLYPPVFGSAYAGAVAIHW